jgi:MazG family protein
MTEDSPPRSGADLGTLIALVERLRAPGGCPWDREQKLPDLRAYLLEEAHEAAAALDGGDWEEIRGELGDLLFQVAFVVRLAEEAGAFSAADVLEGVEAKMVARHPHVFGGAKLADAEAVRQAWEVRKASEKTAGESILDGVPASLPALLAAYRMTQKAAGVGFDWPDAAAVFDKMREEIEELETALAARPAAGSPAAAEPETGLDQPAPGLDRDAVGEEVGDLLFTLANLARKLGLDPEATLAAANAKFRRRFRAVERGLAARRIPLGEASLDEMERLWEASKG